MARRLGIKALAFLCFTCAAHAQEARLRKLKLAPGETQSVTLSEGADLTVSRRGIVDLHHAGEGVWQLTGLRAGIAAIGVKDSEAGDRIIVEVVRPEEPLESDVTAAWSIPEWICGARGIACDRKAGIVSGAATSSSWFLHARRACGLVSGCSFHVTLTHEARQEWSNDLQDALGEAFQVAISSSGVAVVDATCAATDVKSVRGEVDALTRGGVSEGLIYVRCRRPEKRFKLAARVFLVEDATARQLGFDADTTLTVGGRPWLAEAAFVSRLRALAAERKATILGEPVVPLALYEEVKLATGGEFPVLEHATGKETEPKANWKQHGLTLTITGTPLIKGRIRLNYDLSLRSKSGSVSSSGDSALSLNTLKSSIDVQPGEPVAAGVLDLSSEDKRQTGRPLLDSLPIFGPLFASHNVAEARSRLVIWLTLTEDAQVP